MLRKYYILILFLLSAISSVAQDISVADFYLDEMDLTANMHGTTVMDQNGEKCALIKIKTTQTGFNFDVGVLGITKTEQHTAEIRVYVPYGVKRMTISHPQLGVCNYDFPEPIEKARTYVMILDTKQIMPGVYDYDHMQTLNVKVSPMGAYVYIDGTRKQTDSNGMVTFHDQYFGRHPIRVTADDYYQHEDIVIIDDPEKPILYEVNLKPKSNVVSSEKGGQTIKIKLEEGVPAYAMALLKDPKKKIHLIINDVNNGVTEIEDEAFKDCVGLTAITIPEGVTKIGDKAFRSCTHLTSVTIPSSVKEIGEEAFRDCTDLTSVTIPRSVAEIGNGAFEGCTGLTSVTIPSSVTKIGESAFEGCTGLTSVTIPSSVRNIDDCAFFDCTGLTSVNIQEGVTRIGGEAFYGCTCLTSVTIPSSVTKIGSEAFYGCTGLISVTIPTSVTEIEYDTFYGCTSLTSVTIPNSVTEIGEEAFKDCQNLRNCKVRSGVVIGEDAFKGTPLHSTYRGRYKRDE